MTREAWPEAAATPATPHGRIAQAAVDVARPLQIEQRGGVIGVLKHIGRGLIDRNRAGPEYRVRLLPGVQRQGIEL